LLSTEPDHGGAGVLFRDILRVVDVAKYGALRVDIGWQRMVDEGRQINYCRDKLLAALGLLGFRMPRPLIFFALFPIPVCI
jgi:hypothetical protein